MPKEHYTDELWDELIEDLESGDPLRNVSAFCRRHGIARSTPYEWAKRTPEHTGQFARARAAAIDAIVDKVLHVAFDDAVDPAHKRIQCEVLLKYAAKIDPARYGDKLGIGRAPELEALQGSAADLAAKAEAIYRRALKRQETSSEQQEDEEHEDGGAGTE